MTVMAKRTRTSPMRTWKVLLAAFLSLFVIAPLIGAAFADEEPDVRKVDQLVRFPSDLKSMLGETQDINKQSAGNQISGGVPMIDTVNRRMFQLYAVPSGGVDLLIRHLDTLAPISSRQITEIHDLNALPNNRRDVPGAVDPGGKRIFLWVDTHPTQSP